MQRVVTLAISIVFMHIWESAQEMKTQCFLSCVCHWRAESSSFTKLQISPYCNYQIVKIKNNKTTRKP